MRRDKESKLLFQHLKAILKRHGKGLKVDTDKPGGYRLCTGYSEKYKKPMFFAGVAVRKSYVSYHLMPVYMYPELLKHAPPELRRRMQGKSCFNFKAVDEPTFAALDRLTRRSYERFKKERLV